MPMPLFDIRLSCTKQVYGSSSLYYCFFFLFCFQTDGSVPNTLVIANCEVVKPRVAAAEHISQVTHCFVMFFASSFSGTTLTPTRLCMQLNSLFTINCFIF
jgi:hypothetical protein